MADTHTKGHSYHLVDPSPWPVVGASSALVLAVGAIVFMHGGTWLIMAAGLVCVLATMFVWWRDVLREAIVERHHTPAVQIGLRYGMVLFIASEVMFFVAWFWAYFNAALFPTAAVGHVWPPEGIHTFDPWDLPFINTLILLTSGTTVTWAHHCIVEGKRKQAITALWLTILLGASFTCVQAYEYAHAAFGFREGIYGSVFFMATGFHGFHVLVGTIFLSVCLWRLYQGHFEPNHHFGFEAAAWYWHFVDVVWLFLFFAVYIWGG
jgi:cytochrome c oxidase subunit 3